MGPNELIHVKFGVWGVFHHALLTHGHETAEMQKQKFDDVPLWDSIACNTEIDTQHDRQRKRLTDRQTDSQADKDKDTYIPYVHTEPFQPPWHTQVKLNPSIPSTQLQLCWHG